MVTILMHPTGPRDPAAFAPWCRGVVRFAAARLRRARRRDLEMLAECNTEALVVSRGRFEEEARLAARELAACVLGRMDATTRELLLRRYVLEETAADIAHACGRTPAAVRMQLMRARDGAASRQLT